MKQTDVPGNGNRQSTRNGFTTQLIEENPYLKPEKTTDEGQTNQGEYEDIDQIVEDEDGAPVELEDERRKVKQRRRRLVVAALGSLLLIALVIAIAFYRFMPTRVEYGQPPRQSKAPQSVPTNTTPLRDTRTDKAIEEAERLTTTDKENSSKSETKKTDQNTKTLVETPFKFPSGSNESLSPATTSTTSSTSTEDTGRFETKSVSTPSTAAEGSARGVRSQRSTETSLYMGEPAAEPIRTSTHAKPRYQQTSPIISEKPEAVTLPGFASMLPVRTIGALYTLRTGALVRLELTREIQGDGWSMKRGTILVGTTKGGDLDRAYVSLIGFIDPQNGKLVKLEGDLLGGDGAVGLKGKSRQLDGGWARALGRFASSALDVTGALLSGRGRDTVVISDGLRTKAINPVTDELSGVLGSELDRRQGRSFVEVMAGTPGYILVTELPSTIDGKQATPEVNTETLRALTDVDAPRQSTGLSERELAELLAHGSQDEIRAALPRMSPEMRKIAQAVLRP
jgi:hypothetical protein